MLAPLSDGNIIYFQVVLILANKQDLPNAMNVAEITAALDLDSLKNRNVHLQVRRLHSKLDVVQLCETQMVS